jgi:VanZ family protein
MFMREVYWAVSRRFVLLIVFMVVAAALLLMPMPFSTTLAGRTIENAGHTPLFAVGTLCILSILRHDYRMEGPRLYALAGFLGASAGFVSEVIQQPLHRDASWEDVIADALGAILALALYALFDRWSESRRRLRSFALVVIAACAVQYMIPLVNTTRAYLYRNGQFPVLASFNSRLELYWLFSYGLNREIKNGALDVEFEARVYPGLSFFEPKPDWREYKTLVVDAENLDDTLLYLGLRVNDLGHGKTFVDRFNRITKLGPRERRAIEYSLEDLRHGPRNRLMNMAEISDLTLFRGRDSGSQHMRLYSISLR